MTSVAVLFHPSVVGTDAHLDALDALRARGEVVEIEPLETPGVRTRRTFVALSYAAVTEAAEHAALSSRFGTGVTDVPEATDAGVPFTALNLSDGAAHGALRSRASAFAEGAQPHAAQLDLALPIGELDALAFVRDAQARAMRPAFARFDDAQYARGVALAHEAAFAVHDRARAPRDVDAELVELARAAGITDDTDAWLARFLFLTAFVTTELAALELLCAPRGTTVDESLRMQSPVARFGRVALADLVLAGVHVPSGARVILSFAGANHDPRVFPAPRTYAPRTPRSLAFGAGPHACLGAPHALAVLHAIATARDACEVEIVAREPLRSSVNRGVRSLTLAITR